MKSILQYITKNFIYMMSFLFIIGIFSNPMKVHAGQEIFVSGGKAKTGYHFEYGPYQAGETLNVYVDKELHNGVYKTSCIHGMGCTVHTDNYNNCFIPHYAYPVFCKDCYLTYGVKVGLINAGRVDGGILYYPSYANYSNFKQYIQDVEDGKTLPPSQVTNGAVYNFLCYNCGSCNQHIWWKHRHIKEVANTYNIVFHSSGGKGNMTDQSMIYDVSSKLTKNTYTKNYSIFLGWDTDPSADTVIYTDEEVVNNLTSVNYKILHLYAVWGREDVTLTINPNGGYYNGSTSPTTYKSKIYTNVALSTPTKSGSTFIGWKLINGDGQINSDVSFTQGSVSSTIIALWNTPLTLDVTASNTANSYKGASIDVWKDTDYASYATPIYKRHTKHIGNTTSGGACYSAKPHTHTGSPSSGGGCYTIPKTTTSSRPAGLYNVEAWEGRYYRAYYYCAGCGGKVGMHTQFEYNADRTVMLNKTTYHVVQTHSCKETTTTTTYELGCDSNEGYELSCGYNIGDIEKYTNGQNIIASYYMNIDYKLYRKLNTASSYGLIKNVTAGTISSTTLAGLNQYSYTDNTANDITNPGPIYEIKDNYINNTSSFTFSWDAAIDKGTTYDYYVASYQAGSSTKLKTSNEQSVSITSGIKGYYCILNTSPTYTINNSNKTSCTFTATNSCIITKPSTSGNYYLHVAAVDNAGNIGETRHSDFTVSPVEYTVTYIHQKWDNALKQYVSFSQEQERVYYGKTINPKEKIKNISHYIAQTPMIDGVETSGLFTVTKSCNIVLNYMPNRYPVTIVDKCGDVILQTHPTDQPLDYYYGDTISGADLGTNTTIGAYYPNYRYVSSTSAIVNENGATVYRYFESSVYKINYVLNNGTNADGNPTSANMGEFITINHPTRKGYVFKGWNITGMSNSTHIIGDEITDVTSKEKVTATSFYNLTNVSNGTITFTALWMDEEKPDISYVLKNKDGSAYIEGTWTGQDVTLTYTVQDESGIKNVSADTTSPKQENVEYKQFSNVTTTVTGSIVFGEEYGTGVYEGKITAKDNADLTNTNNIANPNGANITIKDFGPIKIDHTLPEGEISYDPDKQTNEDVTITITAEDKHSGLHEKAYSWDKGVTWTDKNELITETNVKDEVWVRDAVGNIEKFPYEVIWIDKLSPKVVAKVETSSQTVTNIYDAKVIDVNESAFEEKSGSKDIWSKTKPKLEFTISDSETEEYFASGITTVTLYETNANFEEDSRVKVSETVLNTPTKVDEKVTLSYTVEKEGENYIQFYTKDVVGNETIINYTLRYDGSIISIDDVNSSIKMASIEKMTDATILEKLNNGDPFVSEFTFALLDKNLSSKIVNNDVKDSAGVKKVYLYLYDAFEEDNVKQFLINYTNESNLTGLLPTTKGNLFDLTGSIQNKINTTHSGNVFSGIYKATIDTFETYPSTTELRYVLIVYDNADNRAIYSMTDGDILPNYSIKATIYSSEGDIYNIATSDNVSNIPYFKTGDMGYIDVWTIGYVDSISFDFDDVGNESANAIKTGNLLLKYNLGTNDLAGYSRTISSEYSTTYDGKYGVVNGSHYANHYTYSVEGWLEKGTLIRIPPSYDLESNLSTSVDNKNNSYIYQDHFAKIIANKNGKSTTTLAQYTLYSTDRAGIHYRITHE